MEKLKNLLTSKKFWTLVSAVVAALSAFFLRLALPLTMLLKVFLALCEVILLLLLLNMSKLAL